MRYAKIRDVESPKRGSALSAGIDFFVPRDFQEATVLPNEDILIPSGIIAEIPQHCALIAVDKSGIATSAFAKSKCGIEEKNKDLSSAIIIGAKLIDADYPGEMFIHLINVGKVPITIKPNQKIAQFMLIPIFYDTAIEVPRAELKISITEREGGFGSTNK